MRKEIILKNYLARYISDLGVHKKRHNEELYCLHGKPIIPIHVRCKRLEFLGRRSNGGVLKNFLTEKLTRDLVDQELDKKTL